jgi:hypothetical protein
MQATDGISRIYWSEGTARGWPIRQALSASIFAALALGMFLAVRRISGAIIAPLPPLQLTSAATLLLAWAVAVRALVPGQLAVWLPAGVLLLVAVACSFPGERAIDWLIWLPVFGAFVASHNANAIAPARRSSPAVEVEQMLQQLTRLRTVEGRDVIHGTLVAEFASGEQTATLYVAFCPPFERLPQVEVESSADVKVVQALHNGAQLEVRLPRATKVPITVSVELFATDAD